MGFVGSMLGLGIGIIIVSRHELGKLPVCQILLKIDNNVFSDVSGRCFRN